MVEAQDYPFAGCALTPSVFVEIALELADNRPVKRADLVRRVVDHHLAQGGEPLATDPLRVAKRALERMEAAGLATSTIGHGVWSIGVRTEKPVELLNEYVYCYYLPAYRLAAERSGDPAWPHKVGMTRASVSSRIAAQVGTALPERPVVVLATEVKNAAAIERAIHSVLDARGRRISDAPGAEWFVTNAEEVREIIEFCAQRAS